jgi:hypothetical protein
MEVPLTVASLDHRPERRDALLACAVLAVATASALALLRFVPYQYGPESRHYLLSSQAQVLAAIMALSISVPLMFGALSRYLPSAGAYLIHSLVFIGYTGLYAVSIVVSLWLLRSECVGALWVEASLALGIVCLLSVIPWLFWVAGRMNPVGHVNLVFARASRLTRKEPTPTWTGRFEELMGTAAQFASVACQDGAVQYLDHALIGMTVLLFSDNIERESHYASIARRYLANFARAHAADELGGAELPNALVLVGFKAYVQQEGRMPTRIAETVAVILGHIASRHGRPEVPTKSALIALWIMGAASFVSASSDRESSRVLARAVADIEESREPRAVLRMLALTSARQWVAERDDADELLPRFGPALVKFAQMVDSEAAERAAGQRGT